MRLNEIMINFVASINKQWDSILVCYHKAFPTGHPKLSIEAKNSSFLHFSDQFQNKLSSTLPVKKQIFDIWQNTPTRHNIVTWANTSLNPMKHNICTSPVDNKNSYQNNEICEWMINADSCKKKWHFLSTCQKLL